MTESSSIGIEQIIEVLPHRYPFLLVDRVLRQDLEAGECESLKNVTFNEPFFPGHFPGAPVMPGVMILEAMAQTAGLLAAAKSGLTVSGGFLLYFAGIDKARFKRPVVPGDQLRMLARLLKQKRDIWKFEVTARFDGALACSAEMMCSVQRRGAGTTVS